MKVELIGFLADPCEEVRKRKRHERKIQKFKYFIRQKLTGVCMVCVGLAAMKATSEGITATMLLVPFGVAMIFSSEKMLTEDDIHKNT